MHLLYCDSNVFIAAEFALVNLCDALYDANYFIFIRISNNII